jgi:hypothetical protein
MPLPSGVTYVTVVSVDEFDTKTNKPTTCTIKFDLSGVERLAQINVGLGFLSSFNSIVTALKKQSSDIVTAQNIINNKIA